MKINRKQISSQNINKEKKKTVYLPFYLHRKAYNTGTTPNTSAHNHQSRKPRLPNTLLRTAATQEEGREEEETAEVGWVSRLPISQQLRYFLRVIYIHEYFPQQDRGEGDALLH